ncbi:MAG: hypothetical protein ACLFRI_07840 [Candidatus Izemoplasmataceae bacterium]
MPNYKIAGMILNFDYLTPNYLKDNIEKYEVDDSNYDLKITSTIKAQILPVNNKPRFINKTRAIYDLEDEFIQDIFKDSKIIERYRIDKTFKEVSMEYTKELGDALSEHEYVMAGLLFIEMLLYHKKVALHASGILYNGHGILFSAPSKTGKTTHTNLWKEVEEDILIINDDKPIIYQEEGSFVVSGSPFSGKTKENSNITAPLKAIIFLKQGKENKIIPLNDVEKINHIMRNILRPTTKTLLDSSLDVIENLVETIPMVLYETTKELSSVTVIKNYIKELDHEN